MTVVFILCVFEVSLFEDVLLDVQSIYSTAVNGKSNTVIQTKNNLAIAFTTIKLA